MFQSDHFPNDNKNDMVKKTGNTILALIKISQRLEGAAKKAASPRQLGAFQTWKRHLALLARRCYNDTDLLFHPDTITELSLLLSELSFIGCHILSQLEKRAGKAVHDRTLDPLKALNYVNFSLRLQKSIKKVEADFSAVDGKPYSEPCCDAAPADLRSARENIIFHNDDAIYQCLDLAREVQDFIRIIAPEIHDPLFWEKFIECEDHLSRFAMQADDEDGCPHLGVKDMTVLLDQLAGTLSLLVKESPFVQRQTVMPFRQRVQSLSTDIQIYGNQTECVISRPIARLLDL